MTTETNENSDIINPNFLLVQSALAENPSVLRVPLTPESNHSLYSAMRLLLSEASHDGVVANMRGSDFLTGKNQLTAEQSNWLKNNPVITAFNQNEYSAIEYKYGRLGFVISQLDQPLKDEIAEILKTSGYSPAANYQEHISRLLTHVNAPECIEFAKAVLSNYSRYNKKQIATEMGPESVIPPSRDGNDAFQFWTYGPYVLDCLQGKNRFDLLMKFWAMKRIHIPNRSLLDVTYPGIEGLYQFSAIRFSNYNYLGKDGSSLSHQVAKLMAQKAIIPNIIS